MDQFTSSPVTPLGAQTPQMHPLLPKVIGGFVVVIIAGVYLVWANTSGTWPYSPAPVETNVASPGQHCGGNIATALACNTGYHCAPDPASHLPFGDVGGICVADNASGTPGATTSPVPSATMYQNAKYGFSITLPATWQGYTVSDSRWAGEVFAADGTKTGVDEGPQITIMFPGSSDKKPHEAMPVMVFTLKQWALVSAGDANPAKPFMSVSAAPIGPSELGRNSKYVFALPARYNYDYKPGYEEVDTLVHVIKVFAPAK